MPEPLKNLYNETFFDSLNRAMMQAYPAFDVNKFTTLIFDNSQEAKELKQRMRHITESLHQCLPDYEQAIPILKAASSQFSNTFEHMFFPEYAELYGMKHYDRLQTKQLFLLVQSLFKISESDIQDTHKHIQKYFSFKPISTRKYYAGKHQLSLIINGQVCASKPFMLNPRLISLTPE